MVLVDVEQFDQQRFYLLTHKIKQIKESLIDFSAMKMKGRRYRDDERIARMVVGEIYRECDFDLEKAKVRFVAMSSAEIEPIIKFCANDAANADYWYTYEKQW